VSDTTDMLVPGTKIGEVTIVEEVTVQIVDDLLCTSFEGGMTGMWVARVTEPEGQRCGVAYTHEVISRGGSLIFTLDDAEEVQEKTEFTLTLESVIQGLEKACKHQGRTLSDLWENHDAVDADVVVQFALFGEIVFG